MGNSPAPLEPAEDYAGLALATLDAELPRYAGITFDDHVTTWERVDESLRGHYWMLGAIAYSVYLRFGRRGIKDFARRVHASTRRVEEYASTYRQWQNRDRSQILTFTHHTIASRHPEPESAIERAESPPPDEHGFTYPYSTRELAVWVAGKDPRAPKGDTDDSNDLAADAEAEAGVELPEGAGAASVTSGEPENPTIEQQMECYDICDKCNGRGVVWAGS